ncbi:MAG: hypothetical protein K6T75_08720 [Acetobacteraceae bacterium]|nr:hypothetical protein [Acetobacteraceae bacterium]
MPKAAWWIAAAALLAAAAAVFLASPWPDALETFLASRGLEGSEAPLPAPAPDYAVPGVGHPGLAGSLAGLGGVLVVLVALWGLGRALVRKGRAEGRGGSGS